MLTLEQQKICWRPAEDIPTEWAFSEKRISTIFEYDPNIFKDKTIVDMGCGQGTGTRLIQRHGAKEVIGLDANQDVVRIARKTMSVVHPEDIGSELNIGTIQYINGVMYETSFDNNSIDGITCIETIEHNDVDEFEMSLKEWYRILKPGGFVWLTTPLKRFEKYEFPNGNGDHWIEYSWEEVRNMVSKFKFKISWEKDVRVDMVSLGMLLTKQPN